MRFCDNENLFFQNGRQKINLIIIYLKNKKICILKMLYGKHLLDFLNTCTQICIFSSSELLATFFCPMKLRLPRQCTMKNLSQQMREKK